MNSDQPVTSNLVTYQSTEIRFIWDEIVKPLEKAAKKGGYPVEDLYDGLINAEYQLWTSQTNEIETVLVTAIQTDGATKFCLLLACGGKNIMACKDFLEEVEGWAKHKGCSEMRIYGRKGWARLLDYETVMRKTL